MLLVIGVSFSWPTFLGKGIKWDKQQACMLMSEPYWEDDENGILTKQTRLFCGEKYWTQMLGPAGCDLKSDGVCVCVCVDTMCRSVSLHLIMLFHAADVNEIHKINLVCLKCSPVLATPSEHQHNTGHLCKLSRLYGNRVPSGVVGISGLYPRRGGHELPDPGPCYISAGDHHSGIGLLPMSAPPHVPPAVHWGGTLLWWGHRYGQG